MPVVATAEVDVRAKLDNFQRDLDSAKQRVDKFSQSTDGSTTHVKKLESNSTSAGKSLADMAAAIASASAALDTFSAADAAVLQHLTQMSEQIGANAVGLEQYNASLSAAAQGTQKVQAPTEGARQKLDHYKASILDTGESLIKTLEHLGKLATILGFVGDVAYHASPTVAHMVDSVTHMGAEAAKHIPTMTQMGVVYGKVGESIAKAGVSLGAAVPIAGGLGAVMGKLGHEMQATQGTFAAMEPGVAKVTARFGDFLNVTNTIGNLGLASQFAGIASAAYAVSPAMQAATNERIVSGFKSLGGAVAFVGQVTGAAWQNFNKMATAFIESQAGGRLLALAAGFGAVAGSLQALILLFDYGRKRMNELVDGFKQASAAGVGAEFFERASKAAEKFGLTIQTSTEMLTKFSQINKQQLMTQQGFFSTEAIGGIHSEFQKVLQELVQAGNFAENAGLKAFRAASDNEGRWRAIVALITEAGQKGERLAALKLAQTFAPPEVQEALRSNIEFLSEFQRKADKIGQTDLVNQSNLTRALQMKLRLDSAYDVLRKWIDIALPDVTSWSLRVYGVWVSIVGAIADAAEKAGKLTERTIAAEKAGEEYGTRRGGRREFAEAARLFGQVGPGYEEIQKGLAEGLPKAPDVQILREVVQHLIELNEVDASYAVTQTQAVATQKQLNAAYEAFTRVASDKVAKQQKLIDLEELYNSIQVDTSKASDYIWDQSIRRLSRHIAVLEADSKALDKGVAERDKLRVKMQLLEVAEQAHIKLNEKQIKQMDELADRMGKAAQAAAALRIQFENRLQGVLLEAQGLGLSDDDVKIAQKLKDLYPSMINSVGALRNAMESQEAQEMRANMRSERGLKTANDLRLRQMGLTQEEIQIVNQLGAGYEKTEAGIRAAINSTAGQQIHQAAQIQRIEEQTFELGLRRQHMSDQDIAIATKLHGVYKNANDALKSREGILEKQNAVQKSINELTLENELLTMKLSDDQMAVARALRAQIPNAQEALKSDQGRLMLQGDILKRVRDLNFERQSTLFLTTEEAAIATQLRGHYKDIYTALTSNEAAWIKITNRVKQARDMVVEMATSLYTEFVGALRQGSSAAQAFATAFRTVMRKAVDDVITNLIKNLIEKMLAEVAAKLVASTISAEAIQTTAAGTAATITIGAAGTAATAQTAAAGVSADIVATAATAAGGILTTAADAVAATIIAGAQTAAAILIAAKAAPFQQGGIIGPMLTAQQGIIVPTPPSGMGTAVPILAHPGEEVVRRDDPRNALNGGMRDQQQQPVINIAFTANGRMTKQEIAEHAMTIAQHVSRVYRENPTVRPKY